MDAFKNKSNISKCTKIKFNKIFAKLAKNIKTGLSVINLIYVIAVCIGL